MQRQAVARRVPLQPAPRRHGQEGAPAAGVPQDGAGGGPRAGPARGRRGLIESDEGPMVMEVNSSPGLEGIEKTTGVDVAGGDHRAHRAHIRGADIRT